MHDIAAVLPIMSSLAIQLLAWSKWVCEGRMLCCQGNEIHHASLQASESYRRWTGVCWHCNVDGIWVRWTMENSWKRMINF